MEAQEPDVSAQDRDKLARDPVRQAPRRSPREGGPGAPAVAVAGSSLVPACLGPQLPWELGAGSIATSGGRRRESQLWGPAALRPQQRGQVRLTDRAFPSQGPAAPDQRFSGVNPRNPWPSLSVSNKQRSPVTAGIPSFSMGLAVTSQGSLVQL